MTILKEADLKDTLSERKDSEIQFSDSDLSDLFDDLPLEGDLAFLAGISQSQVQTSQAETLETPQQKAPKRGKKDNYNFEHLSALHSPVLMNILACVAVMRRIKESSAKVYEASLFLVIANKILNDAPVDVDDIAEAMNVSHLELDRFVSNLGRDGLLEEDAALKVKKKGVQAQPPKALLSFSKAKKLDPESGLETSYLTAALTDEGKSLLVDLCYLSVFKDQWPESRGLL